MDSKLSTGNDGERETQLTQLELEGTEPITDYASKNVMIAAERRDTIAINEVVAKFSNEEPIPSKLSVIRRSGTYYGPKLMLHADMDGDQNFLLTAPGPDAFLYLWKAHTDEYDRRRSYSAIAEVKAKLLEESNYKICPDCGEPFKSVQHERFAAMGECPNI